MAAIGGITVLFLDGVPQGAGTEVRVHARPGYGGVFAEDMGPRAPESTVVVRADVVGASAGRTLIRSLEGLRGQTVSLTDSAGLSYSGYLVLDVQPRPVMAMVGQVGGLHSNSTHFVEALVRLRYVYGA